MMKNLVLVLLMMFSIFAYAQNEVDENGLRQGEWLYNTEPDSTLGIYESSLISSYWVNDTMDGFYRIFTDEVLRYEVYVNKGKREGLGYVYNRRGNIARIYSFANDTLKLVTLFNDQGRISSILSVNGDENDGINLEFYNKGMLNRARYFIDGKLEGLEKTFSKGKVDRVILNRDGFLQGFYEDGKLQVP